VTVFGQSGGGAKELALMTTPNAKGLFERGIVQSGATETMGVTFTSKEASQRADEIVGRLLCWGVEKRKM
jgi:para-nitrobenzyl esterase